MLFPNLETYQNLARICLAERRYDEMDDLLTTSLGIDPLNAWALAHAAYAELQTKLNSTIGSY